MRITLRILFFTIISVITGSCFLQKKAMPETLSVTLLQESGGLKEGSIVYALPMSILTVRIEMEKQTDLPGPYSKYAGELLGLDDVITEKSVKWRITGVSVSSHEEADPSEFYVIETQGLLRANALSLRKEGLILDLNPASLDSRNIQPVIREPDTEEFRSYDLGSDEYYITLTDTAYRRLTMDSQFVRVPYIVEKKRKLNEEELAERAARRLMDIREGKILILTGEANVFPQNDAAINEMNRLEKDYLELFTGKNIKERRFFTCQFIPRTENSGKTNPLIRFSELNGPTGISTGEGEEVSIVITPEKKTKDLVVIEQNLPVTEENTTVEKLFYRIPDIANVKVVKENETLYTSRMLIYQLGQVVQLPGNYLIGQ